MKRSMLLLSLLALLLASFFMSPMVAQAAGTVLQDGGTNNPLGLTDVQWYIFGAALFIVPMVAFIIIGRKKKE